MIYYIFINKENDAPPNSLKNPIVGPRMKQWKNKKTWGMLWNSQHFGVRRCVGALRWD
jgi:hypothetical protein